MPAVLAVPRVREALKRFSLRDPSVLSDALSGPFRPKRFCDSPKAGADAVLSEVRKPLGAVR